MMRVKDQLEQRIAEQLLRDYPAAKPGSFDFLVYLIAAARQGHLCVEVTEDTVAPLPQLLGQERLILDSANGSHLPSVQQIIQGRRELPAELVTVVENHFKSVSTPICRFGSRYYLHRHWVEETTFLNHLERVLAHPPALMPDCEAVQLRLEGLIFSTELQLEQGEAIRCACAQTITLISGGPGTGKTYTAGQFLRLFLENLSQEQRQNFQVAVAAPTGKAAAQLQASLARYCQGPAYAQTLHALLRIKPNRNPAEVVRIHPADLFLIDESSMIDVSMMAQLFASLKPGARIVLLGDKDQLPSIEAGNVFADLVNSGRVPCVRLQRSLRTDSDSILCLASAIRMGDGADALAKLSLKTLEQALLKEAAVFFDWASDDPEQLLKHCQTFRLLSPLRKGPWGVDEVNRQLLQLCCQQAGQRNFYAPIMITCNDEGTGLFNGEVGLLLDGKYAFFSLPDGGFRKLSATFLPSFEYAYCMSVHKSQGSEFDTVWLLLPEGAEVFGREMFYTAVTRAKRQIQVWGSPEVATAAIAHKSERQSGIYAR